MSTKAYNEDGSLTAEGFVADQAVSRHINNAFMELSSKGFSIPEISLLLHEAIFDTLLLAKVRAQSVPQKKDFKEIRIFALTPYAKVSAKEKVQAIKALRVVASLGLLEAKELYEQVEKGGVEDLEIESRFADPAMPVFDGLSLSSFFVWE